MSGSNATSHGSTGQSRRGSIFSVNLVGTLPQGTPLCAHWQYETDDYPLTILFGPSGCGKTTLLRHLAGLSCGVQGNITLGDDVWFDSHVKLFKPASERRIGYVFQNLALFPHLNVSQNVAYGLNRLAREDRQQRVQSMLELCRLQALSHRYPHQLSGGQQQRVAIARALAIHPRLLLLDEPFQSLDAPLRLELREELRQWISHTKTPTLLVTHDPDEAVALGDWLIVMDQGRVLQTGPLIEVLSRPMTEQVARIVGTQTICPGRIVACHQDMVWLDVQGVTLIALPPSSPTHEVLVCLRAEEVHITNQLPQNVSSRNVVPARILSLHLSSPLVLLELESLRGAWHFKALITRAARDELQLEGGSEVYAVIKAPAVHLIPRG